MSVSQTDSRALFPAGDPQQNCSLPRLPAVPAVPADHPAAGRSRQEKKAIMGLLLSMPERFQYMLIARVHFRKLYHPSIKISAHYADFFRGT